MAVLASCRLAMRRHAGSVAAGAILLLCAPARAAGAEGRGAPRVTDIIQLVEITSLSASPDGTQVAFRTEQARVDLNTHLLTWYVADVEQVRVTEVGGGGAPLYNEPGTITAEPPAWSPDSGAILFRALVDDAIGIWRAPIDGTGARLVFRDAADVESVIVDGARLRLILGPSRDAVRAAERAEYLDGILVDASVALNQNLVRSGFINGRPATQRLRGPWFTRVGLLADSPRRQRTLDLGTLELGAETPPPPPPAPPQLGVDPGISARSETGAVARAVRENGETRMDVIAAGDRPAIPCATADCRQRIVALVWRPGTAQILFTAQDRHLNQSLYLWDTMTGRTRRLVASDGTLGGDRDGRTPCAVAPAVAVCVASSAVSPPQLVRIDLETGARTTLFDPNVRLRQATMPIVERLAWRTAEGDEFTGILLLPPYGRRRGLPLFVNYYHCGGFMSGSVGDELPFLPMAAAGIAVACINLPPPANVEDNVGRYEQGLRAVRSLTALLGERGTIDRARVGMAGLSFGSEVTMWTLVHSDLLAAAAIASSQMEPTYYWFNSVRGRPQPEVLRRFWQIGAPDETPEVWRRQSASQNTARISAPLLMQLPEQEARNVIELYSRLSRSRTPTELYVFPEAAHLKLQPRQRMAAHERYLDWFRFWLQNYADPDPAKAGQYRRWTELRSRRRGSASPSP